MYHWLVIDREEIYVFFGIATADVSPLGGLFHIAAQTIFIPGKADRIELVLSIPTILEENISEDWFSLLDVCLLKKREL